MSDEQSRFDHWLEQPLTPKAVKGWLLVLSVGLWFTFCGAGFIDGGRIRDLESRVFSLELRNR